MLLLEESTLPSGQDSPRDASSLPLAHAHVGLKSSGVKAGMVPPGLPAVAELLPCACSALARANPAPPRNDSPASHRVFLKLRVS